MSTGIFDPYGLPYGYGTDWDSSCMFAAAVTSVSVVYIYIVCIQPFGRALFELRLLHISKPIYIYLSQPVSQYSTSTRVLPYCTCTFTCT